MKYDFKKTKLSSVLKILGIGFFIWGSLGGSKIHAMEEHSDPQSYPRQLPNYAYYLPDAAAPGAASMHMPSSSSSFRGPAAAQSSLVLPFEQAEKNIIHAALLRAGLAVDRGVQYMTPEFCARYFVKGARGQYVLTGDTSIQIIYSPEDQTWNLRDAMAPNRVKVSPVTFPGGAQGIRFDKQNAFVSTEMSRAIYAALRGAGLEAQGHNFGLDEFQCQKYFTPSPAHGIYVLRNNPSVYVRHVPEAGWSRLENSMGRPMSVSPNFEIGGISFRIS